MENYIPQHPIFIAVTPTTTFTLTSEQLVYHADDGSQATLSFNFCHDNWVDFVNHSDDFPTSTLSAHDSCGIGWRDITYQPPYIELFAYPPVRFVFPSPQTWYERLVWFVRYPSFSPQRAFIQLQWQINAAGWGTFDLS